MTLVVDTGPIVAMLHANDRHHAWALRAFASARPPLATCDAVITEACFLAERVRSGGASSVLALVERGVIAPTLRLASEIGPIAKLMRRYADVPMSFADACLVRMTELDRSPTVWTTDEDFRVYRRHGRGAIALVAPWIG